MRSKLKLKGYQSLLIAIFIVSSIIINSQGKLSLVENTNQVDLYQLTKTGINELRASAISGKITVVTNAGWINLKSAGKSTGFGTTSSPYVIKDLVIDGGGSGNCITIEDSDVHFKIENCSLYNLGDLGISLSNVDNGQLINNSVLNGPFEGIRLDNSNNNIVTRNKLYNILVDGIGVWNSDYNLISDNLVIDIGWGISLHSSDFNNISKNEVNNNTNIGIELYDSNHNYMSENNINYNGGAGIILASYSNYNEVFNNTINSNEPGISIGSSYGNIITENSINDNTWCGIYIDDQSTCNRVSNNHFNGNIDDIRDNQAECIIENPFPVEIAIALGIVFTIVIIVTGLILRRRKSTIEVKRFKKHAKREAKKNALVEKSEELSNDY